MTVYMIRVNWQKGFTLIEILLAFIVLVVGVTGVLALFPSSLKTSGDAIEKNIAASMASSIEQALASAMRDAEYDATTGNYKVRLTYDLDDGTNKGIYEFTLPKLYSDTAKPPDKKVYHHPGNNEVVEGSNPENDLAFKLGADPWISDTVRKEESDTTDPYNQFLFSFDVGKLDNYIYDIGLTPAQREAKNKIYEFGVHILRSTYNSGTGAGTTMKYIDRPFSMKLSVK